MHSDEMTMQLWLGLRDFLYVNNRLGFTPPASFLILSFPLLIYIVQKKKVDEFYTLNEDKGRDIVT